MKDLRQDMYIGFLEKNDFFKKIENHSLNSAGEYYAISDSYGSGYYWFYTYENLFSISISDFLLWEDTIMEYDQPDYISISYYDSVSGEEFNPYKKLSCNSIKGHIGDGLYKALYHKNIPVKCITILLTPKYYEDYLKKHFFDEYENPKNAFYSLDGNDDFPELVYLLNQIKSCKLSGISARLYYEGKISEAISIIINKTKISKVYKEQYSITSIDLENLKSVANYIDDHFAYDLEMKILCRIACMGSTKLKYTFKSVYKSTISEYVINKKMSHAEHLLTNTALPIKNISEIVGYKNSSSFSESFKKTTGITPSEYRKFMNV